MRQVLLDDRGLFFPTEETLVIGDLHLGNEGRIHGDPTETPTFKKISLRFEGLLDRHSPSTVIFNGDTFHHVAPTPNALEQFEALVESTEADVLITVGNHEEDVNNLEGFVDENIIVQTEFQVGDAIVVHGHEEPTTDASFYVIGHAHPVFGGSHAYVYSALGGTPLLTLPAFTDRIDGLDVNSIDLVKGSPLFEPGGKYRSFVSPKSPTELADAFPVNDDV